MKKGFTLIELLAVIVILAIIALIATPIVLNIINDSKESAVLRSAEFYLDGVDQAILTARLNNRTIKDGTYHILENGNICLEDYEEETKICKDNDLNPNNNELVVDVKGEKPNKGTIIIDSGEVSNIELTISDKEIWLDPFTGEIAHKLAPGLYDKNNKLIIGWEDLVTEYNIKNIIENGYDEETGQNAGTVIAENFSAASKLVIGEGVTTIGSSAFYESSLTNITLPTSVTSIGEAAFRNCSNLTSITIPKGVTSIGWSTFQDCSNLKNIILPEGVTQIEVDAFLNCTSLTNITIPNSVTIINDNAFYGTGLTNITIPNSVTSIGYSAFLECNSLTSIVVAEGNSVYDSRDNSNAIIETATNTLILGCKNTTIPSSVTSIGESAFSGCTSLTNITIPNSVTIINDNAFYGTGLTNITIPNSVTSIGAWAFMDCISLESVTIPESVTSIDPFAFGGCTSLSSIKVNENNKIYDSRDNSNAIIETATNKIISSCKNTTIPNSVTIIGWGSFYGNTSLTELILPSNIIKIEENAFSMCKNLTSITIPTSVKNISEAFRGCESLTTIYYKGTATGKPWGAPNNPDIITNF